MIIDLDTYREFKTMFKDDDTIISKYMYCYSVKFKHSNNDILYISDDDKSGIYKFKDNKIIESIFKNIICRYNLNGNLVYFSDGKHSYSYNYDIKR